MFGRMTRSRQYIEPSSQECTITKFEGRRGGDGGKITLWKGMLFFSQPAGVQNFFSNLEKRFLLSLQFRIVFSYILVLHDFFPFMDSSPPQPILHISNGASLTSWPQLFKGRITLSAG